MVGVKKFSWTILGDYCPHYRKDEDVRWVRRDRRHEQVKKAVLRKLGEVYGPSIQCVEECSLNHADWKGRLDILCWTSNEVVVVEVKSSLLERASSHDALQLLIYAALLRDKKAQVECGEGARKAIEELRAGRRKLDLLLAYRGRDVDDPVLISLCHDYSEKLNLGELGPLYSGVRSSVRDSYVIGPWCFTCSNISCPIAAGIRERRGG